MKLIKREELRPGNMVQTKIGKIYHVIEAGEDWCKCGYFNGVEGYLLAKYDSLYEVPLRRALLEDCGFVQVPMPGSDKIKYGKFVGKNPEFYYLTAVHGGWSFRIVKDLPEKIVTGLHRLQNLYYEVHDRELPIKGFVITPADGITGYRHTVGSGKTPENAEKSGKFVRWWGLMVRSILEGFNIKS